MTGTICVRYAADIGPILSGEEEGVFLCIRCPMIGQSYPCNVAKLRVEAKGFSVRPPTDKRAPNHSIFEVGTSATVQGDGDGERKGKVGLHDPEVDLLFFDLLGVLFNPVKASSP